MSWADRRVQRRPALRDHPMGFRSDCRPAFQRSRRRLCRTRRWCQTRRWCRTRRGKCRRRDQRSRGVPRSASRPSCCREGTGVARSRATQTCICVPRNSDRRRTKCHTRFIHPAFESPDERLTAQLSGRRISPDFMLDAISSTFQRPPSSFFVMPSAVTTFISAMRPPPARNVLPVRSFA